MRPVLRTSPVLALLAAAACAGANAAGPAASNATAPSTAAVVIPVSGMT
jgi:hypothetical protein